MDPAAAQFVGRNHGVVGQEGAILDHGEFRRQQCSRYLGVPADLGTQNPQPYRREQARVQREQVVARGIHQSFGGPQLPANPASDRVVALTQSQ